MKPWFVSLVGSLLWISSPVSPAASLAVGDEVDLESVNQAQWVQGEAPASWEPDQVYVFECWATWCGPCIQQIPHMNGLHRKYSARGLRISGMSVWENESAKVEAFVKNRGDKMSYPVAFVGKGGAFEKHWLVPAGVKGIPFTFVVKGGKLVLMDYPWKLTDEVVEGLLSGEEGTRKAVEAVAAETANVEKYQVATQSFYQAAAQRDLAGMKKELALIESLYPGDEGKEGYRLMIAATQNDWSAALQNLNALPDDLLARSYVLRPLVASLNLDPSASSEFVEKLTDSCLAVFSRFAGPADFEHLARVQWSVSQKALVLTSLEKASAMAKTKEMQYYGFRRERYDWLKSQVESGKFPTEEETTAWEKENILPLKDSSTQ